MTDTLESIRERIEGKRVVSANGSNMVLSDGTVLNLYCSGQDCCAYAHGEWMINPENLDAIITDVKVEVTSQNESNGDGTESRATITILHNQNPLALGDCYADDGSGGYYYSVLSLSVYVPHEGTVADVEVVSA